MTSDPDRMPGRRIRIQSPPEEAYAFVPAPLPPDLHYDAALGQAIEEARGALGELSGLGRGLRNPQLLMRPFLRREAVLSSRIEGTQTGVKDLYAYEARQEKLFESEPASPKGVEWADAQEVFNYVVAVQHGHRRLETLPLSLRLIREIHQHLLSGVRGQHRSPGEFRDIQNWIGPPGCPIHEATHVPPPVPQMHEALGELESYFHQEDPRHSPLIRLALIHYQIEAIHPFKDGNGRVGRLLLILLLVHWKLLPLPLLYLSAYFERYRQQYYDLLAAVSERGAWEEWLHFFLRGIRTQSEEAASLALNLQRLQDDWRARLSKPGISASCPRLADFLFERPILTIPQAADFLGVKYPSAKRTVERLVEAEVLRQLPGFSNPKAFAADELLDAVAEPPG